MVATFTVRASSASLTVALFPGAWLRVIAATQARTEAEVFAAQPGAALAVNGPMYDTSAGPRYLLRDRRAGVAIRSLAPDEGATIWVDTSGRATGAYGTPVPASAEVAVQGWPSLVVDGAVTAHDVGTNGERVRRVGLGATADGSVLVVGLVGAMTTLAARLRDEGAVIAGYLDGGSAYDVALSDANPTHALPGWILAVAPEGEALPVGSASGGASSGPGLVVVVALVLALVLASRAR